MYHASGLSLEQRSMYFTPSSHISQGSSSRRITVYINLFLSNDFEHDTNFVHEHTLTCNKIEAMPQITIIGYLSDGCAAQYKHYKNFLNLCYHKDEFGLNATWPFFATSHGKFPCDGIGRTVKRQIARANLHRPLNDQILTFDDVKKFCETIKGIRFLFIMKDDMIPVRTLLGERYKLGYTVPGTRNSHYFAPVSTIEIRTKHVSVDPEFYVHHSFSQSEENQHNQIIKSLKKMDYITCQYDNFCWLPLIDEVNLVEKDVACKFMHPHGPTDNFYCTLMDLQITSIAPSWTYR